MQAAGTTKVQTVSQSRQLAGNTSRPIQTPPSHFVTLQKAQGSSQGPPQNWPSAVQGVPSGGSSSGQAGSPVVASVVGAVVASVVGSTVVGLTVLSLVGVSVVPVAVPVVPVALPVSALVLLSVVSVVGPQAGRIRRASASGVS